MSDGPALPTGIDADISAFVACTNDRVTLGAGPVHWLPLPPGVPGFLGKPKARFHQAGDEVRAQVKWGFAGITLHVSVQDGRLAARTDGFAFGLEGAIESWVSSLNAQLEAHGRRLEAIQLEGSDVVMTKSAGR